MNNILRISIPSEIYIDESLLLSICKDIEENYCFADEILPKYGISIRYLEYWKKLSSSGDELSTYIIEKLAYHEKQWLAKSRKKVLTSNDIRSIDSSVRFYQERQDLKNSQYIDEEYIDDWVE